MDLCLSVSYGALSSSSSSLRASGVRSNSNRVGTVLAEDRVRDGPADVVGPRNGSSSRTLFAASGSRGEAAPAGSRRWDENARASQLDLPLPARDRSDPRSGRAIAPSLPKKCCSEFCSLVLLASSSRALVGA